MMNPNKNIHNTFIPLIILLLAFTGCRKMIEVDSPVDQVISGTVFNNETAAYSALAGLYNSMMEVPLAMTHGGLSVYCGLSSDEIYNLYPNKDETQFRNNQIQRDNSIVNQSFWFYSYRQIYHANSIIEGLAVSSSINESTRKVITGEAKIVRALLYYYNVNLFGDVPYITSTDYVANSRQKRDSTSEIYEGIIKDLSDAIDALSTDYTGAGRLHPNKLAAHALLARVYLHLGNWEQAAYHAELVISSSVYSLEPDPSTVFNIASNETIWQLQPFSTSYFTAEGLNFLPFFPGFEPSYPLRSELVESFDTADKRTSAWIGLETVNGNDYYYPFKYKTGFCFGSCDPEYNIVLRLAEQYLIFAEAKARLNQFNEAGQALSTVRQRAGLNALSVSSLPQAMEAIMEERRHELFSEWGHRWFDLIRSETAGTVLSAIKPGWSEDDRLFPLPDAEIQLNPALTQNPGY